jgi:hypothetical protein
LETLAYQSFLDVSQAILQHRDLTDHTTVGMKRTTLQSKMKKLGITR